MKNTVDIIILSFFTGFLMNWLVPYIKNKEITKNIQKFSYAFFTLSHFITPMFMVFFSKFSPNILYIIYTIILVTMILSVIKLNDNKKKIYENLLNNYEKKILLCATITQNHKRKYEGLLKKIENLKNEDEKLNMLLIATDYNKHIGLIDNDIKNQMNFILHLCTFKTPILNVIFWRFNSI